MKVTYLKYIQLFALALLLALPACNIKEDMSNCPGYFLLDYTAYPQEIRDSIEHDSQINVFVFDDKDVCTKVIEYTYSELEDCGFEFTVPREYSGRNVLVWHGNNSPDYNDSAMAVGASLNDFYLEIVKNSNAGFSHVPPTLWCSQLEKVEFCASKTRHRIYMMRLNTEINVSLGIAHEGEPVVAADMCDFEINISTKNNRYHCDYTICDECTRMTFDNSEEIALGEPLSWGHSGTLRLMTDSRSELTLIDNKTSEKVSINGFESLDLIKYMLDSRRSFINAPTADIDDQQFLDLNKIWNIHFVIAPTDTNGYVAVSLTINGWTVWFDSADLQ